MSGYNSGFDTPNVKNGDSVIFKTLEITDLSTLSDTVITGTFFTTGGINRFEPTWEDLRAPVTAINPPGLGSDPTFNTTEIGYDFGAAGTEFLYITLQMPHNMMTGSVLEPHVHWEPSNADTGWVYWRLDYRWKNIGESASFSTSNMFATASGNVHTQQYSDFATISKPNARNSSMFECKLSRIGGSDTFTGTALLKEFDVHYQIDSLGSDLEASKTVV